MSRILRCQAGAIAAAVVVSMMFAFTASAAQPVPIKLAVQTTIGPSDAPVRNAIYTPADRQRVKIEPVWYGGRGWYGGYRPYYSYYRAPFVVPFAAVSPLPPPYYNYNPPYNTTFYAQPYFAAPPVYAYPAPYYAYRAPRRAVVVGGYYW